MEGDRSASVTNSLINMLIRAGVEPDAAAEALSSLTPGEATGVAGFVTPQTISHASEDAGLVKAVGESLAKQGNSNNG